MTDGLGARAAAKTFHDGKLKLLKALVAHADEGTEEGHQPPRRRPGKGQAGKTARPQGRPLRAARTPQAHRRRLLPLFLDHPRLRRLQGQRSRLRQTAPTMRERSGEAAHADVAPRKVANTRRRPGDGRAGSQCGRMGVPPQGPCRVRRRGHRGRSSATPSSPWRRTSWEDSAASRTSPTGSSDSSGPSPASDSADREGALRGRRARTDEGTEEFVGRPVVALVLDRPCAAWPRIRSTTGSPCSSRSRRLPQRRATTGST